MTLIVRPEAEADLVRAASYYASVGHGDGFAVSIRAALGKVADHPLRYPMVYQQVRRVLVRRYPYAIFYVVDSDRTVVLAVRHQREDPARRPRP